VSYIIPVEEEPEENDGDGDEATWSASVAVVNGCWCLLKSSEENIDNKFAKCIL
jgi:hypothetical protein